MFSSLSQLRFNNPVASQPFSGVRNATQIGNACLQQPAIGPTATLPDSPGLSGLTGSLGQLQPQATASALEDCKFHDRLEGSFAHEARMSVS